MFNVVDVSAQESNVVLFPTDDAFVAIDLVNISNSTLTELTTGNNPSINVTYFTNMNNTQPNLLTIGYLKFDLTDSDLKKITSATLKLNNFAFNGNNIMSVYVAEHNTWSESTLTFSNRPLFAVTPIDTIPFTDGWMEWDVTKSIKQLDDDDKITFVLSVDDFKQNNEQGINFHSKESVTPNASPVLELVLESNEPNLSDIYELIGSEEIITPIISEQTNKTNYIIKKLFTTDDTIVINNYNDPQDTLELQNANFGNLNFTKIMYSKNATGTNEFIATTGFLKFDLSELISEKIIDVKLQMFSTRADTSNADRIISISTVSNGTWNESELNFTNKPEFVKEIAFAEINTVNDWINWNVTDIIKENAGSEITLSASYSKFYPGHEEQTIFNSKESGENIPYLEIVYDEPEGGGCLIATATYGSEMAPQVQQLRELRDNSLLQTETGSAFMESFNSIYYSFSPGIADLERQSPIFKEMVKVAITPLVSSLSLLNYVDIDSEEQVLGYGFSLIVLNIGMYFVAPAMLFWKIKNRIKKN